MKINLENKIVLVTGGSKGIGNDTVLKLGQAGATVAIHCNSNLSAAREIAEKVGHQSQPFQADLASSDQSIKLIETVLNVYGRIDVLVNNAGIFEPTPETSSAESWLNNWNKTMTINLTASALLCQQVFPIFKSQGEGRIINISSRAAFRGDDPEYMAYAASKGGMISLTKTIARGWGKFGIRAFAIAPGIVRTGMSQTYFDRFGENSVIETLALDRITEPYDISPTVVFLASGLADHATGSTIDINGGSYVR